jgi:hypothetical protein
MHMFEIFKFEFVVWLDLNSIEKIKRKENRNFRIKENAKIAQDALSLGLLAQSAQLVCARAVSLSLSLSLSLRGGTHLSAPFLSPARA